MSGDRSSEVASTTAPVVSLLTAPGRGGIALVALAGVGTEALLGRAFSRRLPEVGRLARGELRDDVGVVDEVLVARTAADRFEIGCHGGPGVARRAVAALVALGAREVAGGDLAARGLDPSEHATRLEARERLPFAATELAARVLARQAAGALAERLTDLGARLRDLEFTAARSAKLGRAPGGDPAPDLQNSQALAAELAALEATARLGLACVTPPSVALAGRPNAGKSTLFNALLGRERAIVSPEPGTTRDVLEEIVSLHGLPVLLQDLAGLRATDDPVEREGVARARDRAGTAAVLLLVHDASAPLEPPRRPLAADSRTIVVLTKSDRLPESERTRANGAGKAPGPVFVVSALTGLGLEALVSGIVEAIVGSLELEALAAGAVVFTEAQRRLIQRARERLERGSTSEAAAALDAIAVLARS